MIESIGKKLTSVISQLVALNLSEAETEEYPYAVYDYTPNPVRTKDGIVAYKADVTVSVVSGSFDQADDIRARIAEAVSQHMNKDGYSAFLQEWTPECVEGIWTIEMIFNIKQSR